MACGFEFLVSMHSKDVAELVFVPWSLCRMHQNCLLNQINFISNTLPILTELAIIATFHFGSIGVQLYIKWNK